MLDPVTSSVLGLITSNIGGIAEWIVSTKDDARRTQLESLRSILELAEAQLKVKSEEAEKLKVLLKEVTEERDQLAEKVAYFEVEVEYDKRDGLLYKKGTGEGPCCPNDRRDMTVETKDYYRTVWKCPLCKHTATVKGDGPPTTIGAVVRR
jgi:hypothetical protein